MGGVKDGHVTMDEFINYYTNISTFIDDDDYFDCMIRNVWPVLSNTQSTGQPIISRSDGTPRRMSFQKAPVVVPGNKLTK